MGCCLLESGWDGMRGKAAKILRCLSSWGWAHTCGKPHWWTDEKAGGREKCPNVRDGNGLVVYSKNHVH
jgi:hypothetical protein